MKAIKRKEIMGLVSSLLLALLCSIPVSAQEGKYTLYDLGTLGGSESWAYDINDASQIVGKSRNESEIPQAFIGTKDGIKLLFSGDNTRSSAKAISSDGGIVGFQYDNAFLVNIDNSSNVIISSFIDFGVFPDDTVSIWGLGVNNSGNMAGGDGFWEKGSVYTKYLLGNGDYTRATSVNNLNQVAGFRNATGSSRAFRWDRATGVITDLNIHGDFLDSYATRINNNGEVVGYSVKGGIAPIAHAYLWKNDNSFIDLEGSESANYSEAYGTNDASVVVGLRRVGGVERAFIWDATNGVRDLNDLFQIPAGANSTDTWILVAAYAINNKGEIVGYGYKNGIEQASAFLLTPPPMEKPDGLFEIAIDIRPWNFHNHVNAHARWGLIPVAILSNKNLQAPRDVVKKSLRFGQTGNENSLAFCGHWHWDVNHDGQKDLICYFHEGPSKFQCGDKEGILRGETKDGVEFEGRDMVQVVPCKPFKNHR